MHCIAGQVHLMEVEVVLYFQKVWVFSNSHVFFIFIV